VLNKIALALYKLIADGYFERSEFPHLALKTLELGLVFFLLRTYCYFDRAFNNNIEFQMKIKRKVPKPFELGR